MNKIIDLSVFKDVTLDVKLYDGTILNLTKPTQNMVIKLVAFRDACTNGDNDEMENALNECVLEILNTNKNHITLELDAVSTMPIAARTAIIQGYSEYIKELQANPI